MLCELLSRKCDWFLVSPCCVVPKDSASSHGEETTAQVGMHSHEVWIIFTVIEGAAYVVVGWIDLYIWVRDAQIIQPGKIFVERLGKLYDGFCGFVFPVVDAQTPWLWSEGAVEDWPYWFE
jgi:hypothetical protein